MNPCMSSFKTKSLRDTYLYKNKKDFPDPGQYEVAENLSRKSYEIQHKGNQKNFQIPLKDQRKISYPLQIIKEHISDQNKNLGVQFPKLNINSQKVLPGPGEYLIDNAIRNILH
ncbi:hypothetical protein PPERSA_07448 [Pseudocohnilembus persalinus]|uniref:Uncharacterized protein n=1 Tax=Pseudocohnilembus persalinus TaxID=266149 RepID=A0A0V0QAH3_PSEPJ|nr:hypothetical protein PPERSA_07448 [Pseudocohnilembus persalinus]|eukprot:KRW99205.1 hypothetical protein PPERSA_07448 [Pseudocohnilembus persalinus]